MAKFKVTFDICYLGELNLDVNSFFQLFAPDLSPFYDLAFSFSDDEPKHIYKKEDKHLHLTLVFFLKTAAHRGEDLERLCNDLADLVSYKLERRCVCSDVESCVLLLTPEGYEPIQIG